MAFTTTLRRSISSALPLASRAFQRNHRHSALFTAALYHTSLSHNPSLRPFASTLLHFYSSSSKNSSSDDTLVRVIESEIKYARESGDHERNEVTPEGFPFEIQDNEGLQTISLSREYEGEVIKVEVNMPDLVTGEENDNDDDDDDNEKSNQSSIPLVVTVSKKHGPCLEFGCTAFPDEISIDSLSVKDPEASEDQVAYEGPDFADLDENLQKAFHKYLEIRGIKPNTTNFLHEYMINKDNREYLSWLQKLRKFVEA